MGKTMSTRLVPWFAVRMLVLSACGVALLDSVGTARAREEQKPAIVMGSQHLEAEAWKDLRYQDAKRCVQCHAIPNETYKEQKALDLVLLAEYSIWKTHDKHAQAY